MEQNSPMKILDICRVTPNPESATELTLPLTYFDILLLKYYPTQRLFFFKLTQHESTQTEFDSAILPKLKLSLSLTLSHYLPLAGNITWPADASKPFILYSPNDGVSTVIACSDSDFNRLCKNDALGVTELHPYVPELSVSESKAAIMAIQITFFPSQGFCIGVSSHHGVSDGKSVALFMKSWAHVCNQNPKTPHLPLELTPAYDLTVADPIGLDMIYLNTWFEAKFPGLDSTSRGLTLMSATREMANSVRATFEFSQQDIEKIRNNVMTSHLNKMETHLSAFVVCYAYIVVCVVKAKNLGKRNKVAITFPANCRGRVEPPLPDNYFGNCTKGCKVIAQAEAIVEEDGVAFVAEKLSEKIKEFKDGKRDVVKELEEQLGSLKIVESEGAIEEIGVAGSPQFGMYGIDFGWGKPVKMEIVSIDKSGSNIVSMTESKDGNGGIEIGVVLLKNEMDLFCSLFYDGLNSM